MTTPLPRKRFQIHLSTAVLMMFVAGALMWANMRERRREPTGQFRRHNSNELERVRISEIEFLRRSDGYEWFGHRNCYYGWPFNAMFASAPITVNKDGDAYFEPVKIADNLLYDKAYFTGSSRNWQVLHILANVLIAPALLFAVWFLCERLIRSRAALRGM